MLHLGRILERLIWLLPQQVGQLPPEHVVIVVAGDTHDLIFLFAGEGGCVGDFEGFFGCGGLVDFGGLQVLFIDELVLAAEQLAQPLFVKFRIARH